MQDLALVDLVPVRGLPAAGASEARGCSAGALEVVRRRQRRAAAAGLPREVEFVAVPEWGLMAAEEAAAGDLLHLLAQRPE